MSKYIDLTGRIFGRLTVISFGHSKNGIYWNCVCSCGGVKIVRGTSLNYGSTKSCGCASIEAAKSNIIKSAKTRTLPFKDSRRLKDLYRNMKNRCYDPGNKRYANYGGRGIIVCDEWLSDHIGFYRWADQNGYVKGMSIERINVNGNYEPSNCCIIPMNLQQKNTTRSHYLEWNGEKLIISDWARKLGVKKQALQHRIDRGWSIERIFSQSFRKSRCN